MAPIKSSLSRSVGKLLGVFRNRDLDLNSVIVSSRVVLPTDYIVGSGGVVAAGIASATDGYTYHTFVNPGTFTWTGGDVNSTIEFIIVGGGGGGANSRTGGGGGAGQVVQAVNYGAPSAIASSGITITVGNGGASINAAPVAPGYGGDTIVNSPVGIITAKGGGYGGFSPTYEIGGKDGGSQGGARSNTPMPLTFPGPSYGYPLGETYDFPNDGVAATENPFANWSYPSIDGSGQHTGGGGGGANGVGKVGGFTNNTGEHPTYPTWVPHPGFPGQGYAHPSNTVSWAKNGAGGDGLRLHTYRAQNVLPAPHPYYPLMSQMNGYYGGGGGGGSCSPYPADNADRIPGGRGGGAPGSNDDDTTSCPGMDGTGGGGGGGGDSSGGSAGGKGICIIRYKSNVTQVTGGSKFTSGLRTYHIFTESGMFEVPSSSPYVGATFDALMVGGGGGGGSYNGGGGGAGRRRLLNSNTMAAGRMAVVIGQGGRGAVDMYRNPNTQANFNERGPWGCGGQATYIVNGTAVGMPADSIICGGGAFGGSNSYDRDGGAAPGPSDEKGSGGGACDQGSGGSGVTDGGGAPSEPAAGGGGGGSAANGSVASSGAGGNGGNGSPAPWIPSTLPALFGDPSGPTMWHAGGGGGGDRSSTAGSGGTGGGGDGKGNHSGVGDYLPMYGQYATGGGGGGAEGGSSTYGGPPVYATFARGQGGPGGPGVMIISYPT